MGKARGMMLLAVALVLAACSGASWKKMYRAPSYAPPDRLTIYLSVDPELKEVEGLDEAVYAMLEALQERLAEEGVDAKLESRTGMYLRHPRLELFVREWDPGSRAARYWVGFGAGKAKAVIDCYVVPGADNRPSFSGRLEATLSGGAFGGDSSGASEAAGAKIARTVLDPP